MTDRALRDFALLLARLPAGYCGNIQIGDRRFTITEMIPSSARTLPSGPTKLPPA